MQSTALEAFDKLYHDAHLRGITDLLKSHHRLANRFSIPGSAEQARFITQWREDWNDFTREWTESGYDPSEVTALEAAGLKPPMPED